MPTTKLSNKFYLNLKIKIIYRNRIAIILKGYKYYIIQNQNTKTYRNYLINNTHHNIAITNTDLIV